jgi:CheY-like chemotaxis protein
MLERDYVQTAIDGPNGLEVLRRAGAIHDLTISDLNMPGMDGLVNLGVAGYLTKPLRVSQVLEAAARALGAPAA